MPILALDYGEKRLGFAVSDPDGVIAMPLRVVEAHNEKLAIDAVRRICEETDADKLVVGLPLNMNGTKGPMAAKVKAFADNLSKQISIPIEKWDERLSTSAAERVLLDADMSRRKRKKVRDKLAAQVILQGYLDATAHEDREDQRPTSNTERPTSK